MKRILLIEDDKVLRENTAELLELSGYEVRTATDGKKGIQSAKEYLPDAILCDIMMPEVDGYGVLENLSLDADTRGIPFIFLSAKTERRDVRKGMELGADDYLTKPFKEEELIGAIESRLAKIAILKEASERKTEIAPPAQTSITTIHQLKNFIDDNGTELTFEPGDIIFQDGMNSHTAYLVVKGVVKIHKLDDMGKELITSIYKADDFFGFTSFTKNTVHRESATAMEKSVLTEISTSELKNLLLENHDLAMELMQLLSEDLAEAKKQLLEMAYGSVRRKTASTILKFAEKLQKDSQGNIHILRSDLASVAGMATETLIRTLSSFKKEGLISIEDRNIKILEITKLQQI